MNTNLTFRAVDETGRSYTFHTLLQRDSILLTLKKEDFAGASKLWLLPDLGTAKAGDEGYFILPRNINMVGDLQIRFIEREDVTYTYDKSILSAYGIKRPNLTAYLRIERNYQYGFEAKCEGGVYTATPVFDFTKHDAVYDDIRIELYLMGEDADYNDMARLEREVRLSRGEITTLREKCARPAVEYARKYPLIRIRMGWKPSPPTELHQTPETEPDMFVACDFARVRAIADELKRQGVAGAELQLVGWHRGGHDGRFPQLFPADPRLGGTEGLIETIDYVKSLGYRISTHTNTIDAYEIADTFTWDDIVLDRNGEKKLAGPYGGGQAYHVCLPKQLKNTKRDLPELAALGENGLHFTDVISIVIPDDCHSADHPSTTANGILYANEIIRYTQTLFEGFSSEGCMDFSLPHLDFGLYVTFGNGFGAKSVPICDRFLPFFEIAYHGILLYNPMSTTVNYPIKEKNERLALYLRGGKPSMYYYSKFRTGGAKNWMGETDLICNTEEELRESVACIKRAAEEYAPLADLQLCFIDRYEILDGGIEVAHYENGSRIVGNFAETAQTYEGRTLEAGELLIL